MGLHLNFPYNLHGVPSSIKTHKFLLLQALVIIFPCILLIIFKGLNLLFY